MKDEEAWRFAHLAEGPSSSSFRKHSSPCEFVRSVQHPRVLHSRMISPLRALLFLAVLFPTLHLAAVPTVTDAVATPGVNGSVTLSAKVTSNGQPSTVTFAYGATTTYGLTATATLIAPAAAVSQPVTAVLTNLTGGKTYHFQARATNSDGAAAPTPDDTFLVPVYAPRLTLVSAVPAGTTATLKGRVTANGTPGVAYFEYGLDNTYGMRTADVVIAAADELKDVIGDIIGLARNTTYHYRLVFEAVPGVKLPVTTDATFFTNRGPVAVDDFFNLAASPSSDLRVLSNDSDPDGDVLTITSVRQPRNGTVRIVGNSIIYTPDAEFISSDTFTYTIKDPYGLSDTATVELISLQRAVIGAHGGFIKNASGKEVGYFRIVATASGTFTGHIVIDGERYALAGFFSLSGHFSGSIYANGEMLPVTLQIGVNGSASSIRATFGGGAYTADVNATRIDPLAQFEATGRYTATLPGGTSATAPTTGGGTTDPGTGIPDPGTPVIPLPTTPVTTATTLAPAGTGWVAFKVREDGTTGVKGMLPDGSKFSTKGSLSLGDGGAMILTFYRDVHGTRVVATLTLGNTVTGTVHADRGRSDAESFPDGFDLVFTANGAPYDKPEKGQRALDVRGGGEHERMTVVISGGGLSSGLTLPLIFSERDKVSVDIPESRGLKMKIDRESGRFTLKEAGIGVKGSGVLIQTAGSTTGGSGAGVFKGNGQTGTITLSTRQ